MILGKGSKFLCKTGNLLMIVIAGLVCGHQSVWQRVEMPFTEIALRIEREGGLGQSHAVEHANLEPRFLLIRDDLPVESLVNDNVLCLREWDASGTDVFAACTCQYEIAVCAEDLLGQLAPFIDTLL